jgi:hypothetical protein
MRNLNFLKNRFVRAAALSCSALFLAAPMHNNIDPSLLAAEPYNPELWNGPMSNEQIISLYQRYNTEFRAMHRFIYNDQPKVVFRREGHEPIERMRAIATDLNHVMKSNNLEIYDVAQHLSYNYKINYLNALHFTMKLNDIFESERFQENANCYGYAVNDRNNPEYGVNPGNRYDRSSTKIEINSQDPSLYQSFIRHTIEGAQIDGLIFTGQQFLSRKDYYRIALFVRQANPDENTINEYHWVRQNNDMTWSHKYGNQNVTNIDFAGRVITDITNADFDDYRFIGYFLVPRGGIDAGIPSSQTTTFSNDIIVTARREPT